VTAARIYTGAQASLATPTPPTPEIVPNQQHKAHRARAGVVRSIRRAPSRTRPGEREEIPGDCSGDRGDMELDLLGLGLLPATAGHAGNHTITMHTGRHSHRFQNRSSTTASET
jgi:hypothetical protein